MGLDTQKIVTAYTAYKMGGLNNRVTWRSDDQFYDSQGGRAILNSSGKNPTLNQSIVAHDLLKTLMTQSSNGAALALSRSSSHQSSRVFVDMMNEYSYDLIGKSTSFNSFFQNPAGLTDTDDRYAFASSSRRQLSSADNMARLTGKIMRDNGFTSEMSRRGLPHFNGGQVTKVGFTQAAGRTIVSYIPFPRCKNQGISIALFGENSSTQFSRMSALLTEIRKDIGYSN